MSAASIAILHHKLETAVVLGCSRAAGIITTAALCWATLRIPSEDLHSKTGMGMQLKAVEETLGGTVTQHHEML